MLVFLKAKRITRRVTLQNKLRLTSQVKGIFREKNFPCDFSRFQPISSQRERFRNLSTVSWLKNV